MPTDEFTTEFESLRARGRSFFASLHQLERPDDGTQLGIWIRNEVRRRLDMWLPTFLGALSHRAYRAAKAVSGTENLSPEMEFESKAAWTEAWATLSFPVVEARVYAPGPPTPGVGLLILVAGVGLGLGAGVGLAIKASPIIGATAGLAIGAGVGLKLRRRRQGIHTQQEQARAERFVAEYIARAEASFLEQTKQIEAVVHNWGQDRG